MDNSKPEMSKWEVESARNTVRLGFWTIAYKNHLRGLDELQRRMQLEAMALSLGVGLIAGLGFSTMDIANLISFDAEISHMVMLMSLTYGIGLTISRRKYR